MTVTHSLPSPVPVDETDLILDSYDRPGADLPRPSLASALTWSEVLHGLVNFVVAIPFFVITVVLISVGLGLGVIYVGIPILMAGLLFARATGHVHRAMGYALLGTYVRRPERPRSQRRGPVGAGLAVVRDGANWRAVCFHVVDVVLAPVQFAFTVGFLAYGLGAITYAVWRPYLPVQIAADGSRHRGAQLMPDLFLDTTPRLVMVAVAGLIVLLLMPFVVRFFADIHRSLMRLLLGPAAF